MSVGEKVPGGSPDDSPKRVSIYLPPSWWLKLRQLGLDGNASASSQIAELVNLYLHEWDDDRRRPVMDAAAARTLGIRGYVQPKD